MALHMSHSFALSMKPDLLLSYLKNSSSILCLPARPCVFAKYKTQILSSDRLKHLKVSRDDNILIMIV